MKNNIYRESEINLLAKEDANHFAKGVGWCGNPAPACNGKGCDTCYWCRGKGN